MKVVFFTLVLALLASALLADARPSLYGRANNKNAAAVKAAKAKASAAADAKASASAAAAASASAAAATSTSAASSTSDASDAQQSAAAAKAKAAQAAKAKQQAASKTTPNNLASSLTSSAVDAEKTRDCDQGDNSAASGFTTLSVVNIGAQAAVATVQDLEDSNGDASDIQTAILRLGQFVTTSSNQITMIAGIIDDDSFAQDDLKDCQSNLGEQQQLASQLSGDQASDAQILAQLAQSFLGSTGFATDGANNAIIDCNQPLTVVSG